MINFLMMAWRLMRDAEHARDNGPGGILHKSMAEVAANPSF
jgi:hypothetical protein